jgi:hypothetical protein
VKAGVTCPGLFANWSLGNIGTAWHGDCHMNYNTQQPFWLPFSSNRLDKNLPYVDLIDHMLPVIEKWAKEYYHMRGAFFPHSAYPVEMTHHPYPTGAGKWSKRRGRCRAVVALPLLDGRGFPARPGVPFHPAGDAVSG